jgi:hypothetical protein
VKWQFFSNICCRYRSQIRSWEMSLLCMLHLYWSLLVNSLTHESKQMGLSPGWQLETGEIEATAVFISDPSRERIHI